MGSAVEEERGQTRCCLRATVCWSLRACVCVPAPRTLTVVVEVPQGGIDRFCPSSCGAVVCSRSGCVLPVAPREADSGACVSRKWSPGSLCLGVSAGPLPASLCVTTSMWQACVALRVSWVSLCQHLSVCLKERLLVFVCACHRCREGRLALVCVCHFCRKVCREGAGFSFGPWGPLGAGPWGLYLQVSP